MAQRSNEGARAPSLQPAKPVGASLPALPSVGRAYRAVARAPSLQPAKPVGLFRIEYLLCERFTGFRGKLQYQFARIFALLVD